MEARARRYGGAVIGSRPAESSTRQVITTRSVSAASLVWGSAPSPGAASSLCSSHVAELSPAGADSECGAGVLPRPWYWPFDPGPLDAESEMASWDPEESRPDRSLSLPASPKYAFLGRPMTVRPVGEETVKVTAPSPLEITPTRAGVKGRGTYRRCGLVQKCLPWRPRCPTWPWRSRSRRSPRPPECKACTWSWSGGRWPPGTSPRRWRSPGRETDTLGRRPEGREPSRSPRRTHLQARGHSLHGLPLPCVVLWNDAHFHQQSDEHGLPAKSGAGETRTDTEGWFAWRQKLPEGDEHHHFDAQELAHWFDWAQFLSQSPVEQHQAVHGKLEEVLELLEHVINRTTQYSYKHGSTSCDMLLTMTRYVHALVELKLPSWYTPLSWQMLGGGQTISTYWYNPN